MTKTQGTGSFIYGDKPEDSVSVTWEITAGQELTNKGPWRADILIDLRNDETRARQTSVRILKAMRRNYIFKLKTEDGSAFPCEIYSLEDFSDYGIGLCPLEICNVGHSKPFFFG